MSTVAASTVGNRRKLLTIFGLLLLVLVGLGIGAILVTRAQNAKPKSTIPLGGPTTSGQGSLVQPPRQLSDFSLMGPQGTPVKFSDLRGKAVLLFFGYTHCPDFCPTTLVEFRDAKRALGAEADKVAFVFISVDAEADTPQSVAAYAQNFDPAFVGLSGDPATLAQIGPEYDLYYKKREVSGASSYLIDHTAITYLIDRQGRLKVVFPYGTPASAMATDIKALLAQP